MIYERPASFKKNRAALLYPGGIYKRTVKAVRLHEVPFGKGLILQLSYWASIYSLCTVRGIL